MRRKKKKKKKEEEEEAEERVISSVCTWVWCIGWIVHFLNIDIWGRVVVGPNTGVPNLWPAGQKWPAKPLEVALNL